MNMKSDTTTTTTTTTPAELLAARSIDELFEAAFVLEAAREGGLSVDQRMARAWILEEIEQRVPAVNSLMDEWAMGDDGRSYTAALADAVKAVA